MQYTGKYLITFFLLLAGLKGVAQTDKVAGCRRCLVMAEQSQHRIAIADVSAGKIIWEWNPAMAEDVKPEHVKWFSHPSEAKMVYGRRYVLMAASGGGVALVRIADKKTVFYAYAGGNTHSAELLPDGNIVSASSTGNFLMLFRADTSGTIVNGYTKKIPIAFGHNVVWDARRSRLWTAAMDSMHVFRYNNNLQQPDLFQDTVMALPGTEAHDLFPVFGADKLWLTNATHVYRFDPVTGKTLPAKGLQNDIKSVSSGPAGFPVIVIRPKVSWWTDEVLDANGKSIFREEGLKIYKARWVLTDTFSER
ncbi:DUF6528 family protein [Chitinophaga solisilvae]|uniref:DUF6528 family protein n=1 Tax=Chitinophaga solisilvae TaxID=1233460 RepID=UPI00136F2A75|nr:DUF6528 family protein [Chitinophaga solisilvae]